MGRRAFLATVRLTVEGRAQALKHVKDAVDRSAWLLTMVRKDLIKEPRFGTLHRLEARRALADLESRQVFLSAAYDDMVATLTSNNSMELKLFFLAYDEFLSAVHAMRMTQYVH